MAHHKSALKRIRQNDKRRERNRHAKSTVRGAVKKVRVAVAEGDAAAARERMLEAQCLLHRVARKGIIPRRRAARLTSRLQKAIDGIA